MCLCVEGLHLLASKLHEANSFLHMLPNYPARQIGNRRGCEHSDDRDDNHEFDERKPANGGAHF